MNREEAIRNINALNAVCGQKPFYDNEFEEALGMAVEALENQKMGHWIEKNVNQDGTHNIYCSNCNNYLKFKGHASSYNARTKLKYCPNCGAKMWENN